MDVDEAVWAMEGEAVGALRHLPFAELGFATVDHHRHIRQGMAEAIYGPGKTPDQVARIAAELLARSTDAAVVLTRADAQQVSAAVGANPGIHRLLGRVDELVDADAVVVVAGMEGALVSVVGGLTGAPVVAVPTSVGYGAGLEGVTALLGMLATCAAGITVVGIDNGYGAACAVARLFLTPERRSSSVGLSIAGSS